MKSKKKCAILLLAIFFKKKLPINNTGISTCNTTYAAANNEFAVAAAFDEEVDLLTLSSQPPGTWNHKMLLYKS